MRRRGSVAAVLALVLLAAALVIVSTGLGSSGKTHAKAAAPVIIGKGGGFGEVYEAKASTLKRTLFNATLLPKNPTSRKIALAGLGRADRKVNLALALRCWKNNVCNTGTGGKLTVAYIEQFGENVYRQMSHMEFILQALTYPQVGRIIYKSAHSDLNQGIADFKAAIAQKVSLIVTYPDFGDAMLPVMKEATDAGIPVATYAWGYVTGPGKNYLTVVGEYTCNLGKAFAAAMNKQVGSGDIAFMGGFPGNPLSEGWQKLREAGAELEDRRRRDRADELGSVEGPVGRRRHPRGASQHQGLELRVRRRHGPRRHRGVQGRGQAVQPRADAQDGRRPDGV